MVIASIIFVVELKMFSIHRTYIVSGADLRMPTWILKE